MRMRPPVTTIVGLTVGGSGGDAVRRRGGNVPGPQVVEPVHRVRPDAGDELAKVGVWLPGR
jgi:hypothetical protein